MKVFIALLFLVFFSFSYSQKTKEVSISNAQGKLYGTLTLPKKVKNPPVAIFISGSGPTDRDGNNPMAKNNSLKFLSDELVANGVATLRYDKQGIGASKNATKSSESELVFDDFVEDLRLWIDFIQKQKGLGEITLIGHSEGSLIALLAAQTKPVKQVISIAGAGRPIQEILVEQVSAQDPKMGLETKEIVAQLAKGQKVDKVSRDLAPLFRESVQPYLISWMQIDPAKVVAGLKVPVIVIQGDKDIQVSVQDAVRLHAAAKNGTYHLIKGMNHILKYIPGDALENRMSYMNGSLSVMPELVQIIVEKMKG
jgi:uncharacterized protein